MFLAVILVGGENGDAVCLCKGDSQEHISSVMITSILILHFQFFKYNRCILGFIFDIIPILRFFAPQELHVTAMGVKFGMKEGAEGPLLRAKFQPHRCNDKGVGPQKLKFLLRFDRNLEYKRPAGAYPLRDFHKIRRVCTPFQDALGVKISLDLLKGLWSDGGFN